MKYYTVQSGLGYHTGREEWNVYCQDTPPIIQLEGGCYLYSDDDREVVARVDTKDMAIKIATLLTQEENRQLPLGLEFVAGCCACLEGCDSVKDKA